MKRPIWGRFLTSSIIHYYQGVTTGGNEQTAEYGGVVDMYFTFLGEKFGINASIIVPVDPS